MEICSRARGSTRDCVCVTAPADRALKMLLFYYSRVMKLGEACMVVCT